MTNDEQPPVPSADAGGDPACWLSRVCPDCGRFAEDEDASHCARCGHALERD